MWSSDNAFFPLVWNLVWRFGETQVPVLFVGTWFATIFASVIAYRQNSPDAAPSLRGWVRFCLPGEILSHPSCRLDIVCALLFSLIRLLLLAPIVMGNLAVATAVYLALQRLFGPRTLTDVGMLGTAAIVAACVVLQDAISFHVHFLEHRLRLLWEVHKVHHSIEYLLPVCSGRRVHPIEHFLNDTLCSAGVGLLLGVVSYALSLVMQDSLIFGADAFVVVNTLSFNHLRHSHIALRYGWLERYLISPAQHHIHHSHEHHLRDKNFGTLLSLWDRLYGTIVYSDAVGAFRIGLPPEDSPADYDGVWKLLLIPIRNLARLARRPDGPPANVRLQPRRAT